MLDDETYDNLFVFGLEFCWTGCVIRESPVPLPCNVEAFTYLHLMLSSS